MNSTESLILSLSRSFIAERYADEIPFFPVVWERFIDIVRTEGVSRDVKDPRTFRAGLPFADEQPVHLHSPFVLFTLERVFREMTRRNANPEVAKLRDAIRGAARGFGASPKLVEEMVEDLAPELHESFRLGTVISPTATSDEGVFTRSDQGEALSGAAINVPDRERELGSIGTAGDTASQPRPDHVFIDRRVDGHRRKCGWHNKRVRHENRKNPKYDLVVDEVTRELLLRKNRICTPDAPPETVFFRKIEPRAAGMLWLTLQKFGGDVTYGAIREHFGLADDQKNAVHQAKNALKSLLEPTLHARLIGEASDGCYPITSDQVNYCWIRCDKSPSTSGLRYRIGSPRE